MTVTTLVEVPRGLLDEICAHARACFPEECCGYLVGAERVDALVRCHNAAEMGPGPFVLSDCPAERGADTAFLIAGRELFDFARSFETARPARVVYHSHTNGRAYLSALDRAMAREARYPVQHLVVALTATGITEAAQFAWSEDAGDFVELARWVP